MSHIFVGTAGWSVPKFAAEQFPETGTHLERYAHRLSAVEINTSFYRRHQTKTYEKWAKATPDGFRFAVKMPKLITHEAGLKTVSRELDEFAGDVAALGEKLGVILIQTAPSLQGDLRLAAEFFGQVRQRFSCAVVFEPRHFTWCEPGVRACLKALNVGYVLADPELFPILAEDDGGGDVSYFRYHGSPEMYYSNYGVDDLATFTQKLRISQKLKREVWCIFDNTAAFHALPNALTVIDNLEKEGLVAPSLYLPSFSTNTSGRSQNA